MRNTFLAVWQACARVGIAGCIGSLLSPVGAQAQQLPDPSAELRRQQERAQAQQDLLQAPRKKDAAPQQALPLPTEPARLPANESPCFAIRSIVLREANMGKTDNALAWLDQALSGPAHDDSPLGKCLGARGVGLVIQRAQDALVARGFVTSRILAPAQDLSSGNLVFDVVPGRVHAIRFAPGAPRKALFANSLNSVPAHSGDILNLRDVEQALENFKRVPTVEADIKIEPAPTQPDQSDLVILHQQGTLYRFTATLDDSGSKSTGKYQGSATLSLDNPLGLSDLFYATLNHDLNDSAAQGYGTHGNALHYSLPYGYWTLGATAGSSRYFQQVAGLSQTYTYSGTSENNDIKLSRLVYRDAVRKTTFSLKAWQRKSNNFIDDTEVEVQRRVMGGWEFGVAHKEFVGQATVEANLAYKIGTSDFGAIPAPEEAFNEGTSKFGLITLDASASVPFQLMGAQLRYNGALRVQDSTTRLIAQDRFSIGGRYTVRGFDGDTSLSAERGWLLRNEVSTGLGQGGGWGIGAQQLYLGLDFGEVSGRGAQTLLGNTLAGAVVGLRGAIQKMQYEVFIGTPVNKPVGFTTADTTFGFSLNLSL